VQARLAGRAGPARPPALFIFKEDPYFYMEDPLIRIRSGSHPQRALLLVIKNVKIFYINKNSIYLSFLLM